MEKSVAALVKYVAQIISIYSFLFVEVNSSSEEPAATDTSTSVEGHETPANLSGVVVYNPFESFHITAHTSYIAAGCWILVLIIVRRIFHVKFRCCKCLLGRSKYSHRNGTDEEESSIGGDSTSSKTRTTRSRMRRKNSMFDLLHASGLFSSSGEKGDVESPVHRMPRSFLASCNHRSTLSSFVPESTALVLVGAITGIIFWVTKLNISDMSLNPEVVFNILIVPIVMDAGWCVDKTAFYRNIGTILLFAVAGTMINATMLAPLFYYGSKDRWGIFSEVQMDPIDAGIYAVIICAVDPVAVLSVFESMHIDKTLYVIVFGESLLNDGVSVVFYHAFDEMKALQHAGATVDLGLSLLTTLGYFTYSCFVSFLFAVVFSLIISFLTKVLFETQQLQLTAFLGSNYLCYVLAETAKGSGILSLFFCVLFQRQFVGANLSYDTQTTVSSVLNQAAQMSEGIIFLLMGLTTFADTYRFHDKSDIRFFLFVCGSCYVSRYIVVYSLGFLANQFRVQKMDYRGALFIQSHGGLRGAIGYSLALILDNKLFPQQVIYARATAFMVYFSVVVLGTSIKPLVLCCNIRRESQAQISIFLHMQNRVIESTMDFVGQIAGVGGVGLWWRQKFNHLNNHYLKRLLMHASASQRTCTSSGIVTLHLQRRMSEAQLAVTDGGSMMMLSANRESFISIMSNRSSDRHNTIKTVQSENILSRFQDELKIDASVPDLSILDLAPNRRDADDCMTHHNVQDMNRKHHHKRPIKSDKSRRLGSEGPDSHRSHCYKHSHRVVAVHSKDLDTDPEEALTKMRRNFEHGRQVKAPKTSVALCHEIVPDRTERNNSLPQIIFTQYSSSSLCDSGILPISDANSSTQDSNSAFSALQGSRHSPPPKVIFTMHDDSEDEDEYPPHTGLARAKVEMPLRSSSQQSLVTESANGRQRKIAVRPGTVDSGLSTLAAVPPVTIEKKVSFQCLSKLNLGDGDDDEDDPDVPTKEQIRLREELENATQTPAPEVKFEESVVERSLPWKRHDDEDDDLQFECPQLAHEPFMPGGLRGNKATPTPPPATFKCYSPSLKEEDEEGLDEESMTADSEDNKSDTSAPNSMEKYVESDGDQPIFEEVPTVELVDEIPISNGIDFYVEDETSSIGSDVDPPTPQYNPAASINTLNGFDKPMVNGIAGKLGLIENDKYIQLEDKIPFNILQDAEDTVNQTRDSKGHLIKVLVGDNVSIV